MQTASLSPSALPVDGFFEWQAIKVKPKPPYAIALGRVDRKLYEEALMRFQSDLAAANLAGFIRLFGHMNSSSGSGR